MPEFKYAGFWHRAAAALLDALVLICIQIAVLATCNWFVERLLPKDDSFPVFLLFALLYSLPGGLLALVILPWLYFAKAESGKRQATFGKKVFRLHVVNTKGQRFSFWKATLKLAIQSLAWLTVFLVLTSDLLAQKVDILDPDSLIKLAMSFYIGLFSWSFHEIPYESLFAVIVGYTSFYLLLVFTKRKQTLFDKLTGRFVIQEDCPLD